MRVLIMALLSLCVGSVSGAKQPMESFASEYVSQFKQENNEVKYKSDKRYKRTIYIDAAKGSDKNEGSKSNPIQSLDRLAKMGIKSGDQILLKGGERYVGTVEFISLSNVMVGSYGESKATIDAKGYPAGVMIRNSSDVVVCDLKINANGGPATATKMVRPTDSKVNYRAGVYIDSQGVKMSDITLYNVDIKDIYFYNREDTDIPFDERPCRRWGITHSNNFGWGIKGVAKGGGVKNITIEDCHIKATSRTAIQLNGNLKGGSPFENLTIKDCSIIKVGGPGIMYSGVKGGSITHTRTYCSGDSDDRRMWGRGSGSWMVWSEDVLYEHCMFERAEGIGDCCGLHIDMGNKNVVAQYCFSKDNAGGFIEILGKNYNCSYRYNISLNDGWRNPKSDPLQQKFWNMRKDVAESQALFADNAAGSLGCIVTINGHSGKEYVGPFQSYVYNNTIVCTESREDGFLNPYVFQIATTSEGLVMMNNIFWIAAKLDNGWSVHQYKDGTFHSKAFDFRTPTGELDDKGKPIIRDMNEAEMAKADVVFKNNLYRLYDPASPGAENVLPSVKVKGSKNHYIDEKALGGDPGFAKSEGWQNIEDMIPSNAEVINQGVEIPRLRGDKSSYPIRVEYDFFGNRITTPIIGACVVK